jgi:hypothetical protein
MAFDDRGFYPFTPFQQSDFLADSPHFPQRLPNAVGHGYFENPTVDKYYDVRYRNGDQSYNIAVLGGDRDAEARITIRDVSEENCSEDVITFYAEDFFGIQVLIARGLRAVRHNGS